MSRRDKGIPFEVAHIPMTVYEKDIKNLYVRVKPPRGEIVVSKPYWLGWDELYDFVEANMTKIIAMQRRIWREAKSYETGEMQDFWGREVPLRLEEGAFGYSAGYQAGEIRLQVPPYSTLEGREKAMVEFYRAELKFALPQIIQKCEARTGLRANEYRVRKMKTRWGTCNIQAKRIWLSLELAKYPKACSEYVLTHELAHLLEPYHNKHFYQLMDKFYPNWKETKAILDKRA